MYNTHIALDPINVYSSILVFAFETQSLKSQLQADCLRSDHDA